MSSLDVQAGMALPSLPEDHGVRRLVELGLERRGRPIPDDPPETSHWEASFFGLDRVEAFRDAGPVVQGRVVENAGRQLIREAFFIERAGIAFASKMTLLSPTIDERQLYALFASDEASHLALVAPFADAPEPTAFEANAFLKLLDGLIAEGTRAALQVIIQVVLEGWGLSHYRSLRDGCHTDDLRAALTTILADEAAHHGSGVLLTQQAELTRQEEAFVRDTLEQMLRCVRLGPQSLLSALEAEMGSLTRGERLAALRALDAERHSRDRLRCLARLTDKTPACRSLVADLAARGAFEPFTVEQLA